ncbi:hypothetical protein BLNAU_4230 [Blattamonas nauphoetae]|uniref:NAD(+)--protein-arginine ADP-ribosyltransferase n=1 Tax=Blattamonas nauphoetae TaxID=2049346 RepID=A0ABQ9YAX2_9EUKA|nr:hypothetical protein BLNAU_4230 [Blattamonas nauphoetae]
MKGNSTDYTLTRYEDFYHHQSCLECLRHIDSNNAAEDRFNSFTSNYEETLKHITEDGLSKDEMMAIYHYTEKGSFDVNPQLTTGEAGLYNCYLEYFFSAMDKLPLPRLDSSLYKGIPRNRAELDGLIEDGVLTVDLNDSLIANSIVSAHTSLDRALSYATEAEGTIIEITNPVTAKNVVKYSNDPVNHEYVYLPQTRFIVSGTTKKYCDRENIDTPCRDRPAIDHYEYNWIYVTEIPIQQHFVSKPGKDPKTELLECYDNNSKTCKWENGRPNQCLSLACYDANDIQIQCPYISSVKELKGLAISFWPVLGVLIVAIVLIVILLLLRKRGNKGKYQSQSELKNSLNDPII